MLKLKNRDEGCWDLRTHWIVTDRTLSDTEAAREDDWEGAHLHVPNFFHLIVLFLLSLSI